MKTIVECQAPKRPLAIDHQSIPVAKWVNLFADGEHDLKQVIRIGWTTLLLVMAVVCPSSSDSYQYLSADDLLKKFNAQKALILIDICPAPLFAIRHIPGSIETGAYPVKTAADKARLEKVLPQIEAVPHEVVIICPRGGQSAHRAFDHLKSKGVHPERIYILTRGILGWPHTTQRKPPTQQTQKPQ